MGEGLSRSAYSFNTWAREEPNACVVHSFADGIPFQYLGSRGAQRLMMLLMSASSRFQYLGSRGAQLRGVSAVITSGIGFNTWAREEPNGNFIPGDIIRKRFNTWAREEPNFYSPFLFSGQRVSFNTWAREEPNALNITRCI